jgi:hypothetical protein
MKAETAMCIQLGTMFFSRERNLVPLCPPTERRRGGAGVVAQFVERASDRRLALHDLLAELRTEERRMALLRRPVLNR